MVLIIMSILCCMLMIFLQYMNILKKKCFKMQEKTIGPPDIYLGDKFNKVHLPNIVEVFKIKPV